MFCTLNPLSLHTLYYQIISYENTKNKTEHKHFVLKEKKL